MRSVFQAFARGSVWLRRRWNTWRRDAASTSEARDSASQGHRVIEDRARFWAELREGRDQAEKACATLAVAAARRSP